MTSPVGSPLRKTSGLALATVLAVTAPLAADEAYRSEVRKWREEREARLKADGGWLTVAGLFWLKEGANRFGTDPTAEVVLPPGSAPAVAGAFVRRGDRTVVKVAPGVPVTCESKPVTSMRLRSDAAGEPDVIRLGTLAMQVIQRGDRYGVRLKDMESARRREFKGLRWFPIDEAYRMEVPFVAYEAPRPLAVPNVLGQISKMPSLGYAAFEWKGKSVRLEGVLEEPDATQLFFIFRDLTSGKETYPAGRFLYADLPRAGRIVLDFNEAYNPPCAFTPYATCPLPPPGNWLPVRIEAGELAYGAH